MGRSPFMASYTVKGGLDDFNLPINRTVDDSVDEAESLPFRYQKRLVEVELPL